MKENATDVFTPEVKALVEAEADKLAWKFHLDPLRRNEARNNMMQYLWRNARYYNPELSGWKTFAWMVVTSGVKRERERLTAEAKLAAGREAVPTGECGGDELPLPDPRNRVDELAFALDLADVLARMPRRSAELLHAVVVEGLSFREAAERFGIAERKFYRRTWPRARKDFLRAGGEFFRAGRQ